MDSCATPNVLSQSVVDSLSISLEDTKKLITVANGENSGFRGKIFSTPVDFDNVKANSDFVFIENLPYDVVIDRSTIKRLGVLLDFQVE